MSKNLFDAIQNIRLANMGVEIEYVVNKAMLNMFLELPDDISRNMVVLRVEKALGSYITNEKIRSIICDDSNNTPNDIQNGNIILDVIMWDGAQCHFSLLEIIQKYKKMVTI